MVRKTHTAEEINNKLRAAEVIIAWGGTVVEAARRVGVSEQTLSSGIGASLCHAPSSRWLCAI